MTLTHANSLAWAEGLRQLRFAIETRSDFTFESTLGGRTITDELLRAAEQGIDVKVWYVGLSSPEHHIARVAERVAKGGHPIPEEDIRRRFQQSRINLIRLMPKAAEIKVFDNSAEADPRMGVPPEPRLLLHLKRGKVVGPGNTALARTPEWAKPLVEAALGP